MIEEHAALLARFGLSPTAARVYLALLDLGKASADKLATRAGTYKANVYGALDRLMEHGLASSVTEGRRRLYVPTSPEKLPALAEEARRAADERYALLKADLERALPQLAAKAGAAEEPFEVYRGKAGYRALLLDILRERPREWKGFGNLQIVELFPHDFRRWFQGVRIRLFSARSEAVLKRLARARRAARAEIRWLPSDLFMPIVWVLFGSNLLIALYEPDIIVLRIRSEQVVRTFESQFEFLWKSGPGATQPHPSR